jgi:hypothetical protein
MGAFILTEAEDLLRRGGFEWSDDDDAYRPSRRANESVEEYELHRRFLITRKELADYGLVEGARPRLLAPQKKAALDGLELKISFLNARR